MTGSSIRQFLRDLFGSRLIASLELQLLRLRTDYDERLQDKELTIATLREEKAELSAKILTYENTIMPLASRAGAEIVKTARPSHPKFPNFDFSAMPPTMSRWQKVQADHDKQMEEEIETDKAQAAQAPQGTA